MIAARAAQPRSATPVVFAAGSVLASLAAAWLAAHERAEGAAILVVGAAAFIFAATRRENGILVATALILVVPYQTVLLVHQLNVTRLAALLALSGLFVGVVSHERREQRTVLTAADAAALLFASLALVSWLSSRPVPSSLQATVNAMIPLAFYVAGRRMSWTTIRPLAWTIVIAGSLGATTVLVEYFVVHRPLFIDPTTYLWNAKGGLIFRPGGIYGSPPAAATILAMTAIVGAGLHAHSARTHRRILNGCIALVVVAVFVTFTRAGLIALAAGVIAYIALIRPTALMRVTMLVAALTLVLAVVALPRIEGASWYQQGVLRQGDLGARQSYWRQAWPLITNSPTHLIVGHGINSLVVGRPELPGPPDPDLAQAPVLLEIGPHNQYVRTLFEEGAIGLALLLLWLGRSIVSAASVARTARELSIGRAAAALAGAIVAFGVASSAGDSLRHPATFALVALLAGVANSVGGEST